MRKCTIFFSPHNHIFEKKKKSLVLVVPVPPGLKSEGACAPQCLPNCSYAYLRHLMYVAVTAVACKSLILASCFTCDVWFLVLIVFADDEYNYGSDAPFKWYV